MTRRDVMTEEEILAATVGERRPHDGPVVLVDYDPAWPELFEREATRIRDALGPAALAVASTRVVRLGGSSSSRSSAFCASTFSHSASAMTAARWSGWRAS